MSKKSIKQKNRNLKQLHVNDSVNHKKYGSELFKQFSTSNYSTKAFGSNKYSRKQKHKKDYSYEDKNAYCNCHYEFSDNYNRHFLMAFHGHGYGELSSELLANYELIIS